MAGVVIFDRGELREFMTDQSINNVLVGIKAAFKTIPDDLQYVGIKDPTGLIIWDADYLLEYGSTRFTTRALEIGISDILHQEKIEGWFTGIGCKSWPRL